MDDDQAAAKTRVEAMLNATGLTATELARKAGLTPSTLTRFMNKPVKHSLSARTLAKIEAAAESVLLDGVSARDTTDLGKVEAKKGGDDEELSSEDLLMAIWAKISPSMQLAFLAMLRTYVSEVTKLKNLG